MPSSKANNGASTVLDRTDRSSKVSSSRQTGLLEKYHWFVRSHLADWAGGMANAGADSTIEAARAVAAKTGRNAARKADFAMTEHAMKGRS